MIKLFGSSNEISTTAPAKPSAVGKISGWFQKRAVIDGKFATKLYAWWFNMIQAEILSAIAACGLSEDPADDAQLGKCFDKKANRAGDTFTGAVTFKEPVHHEKGVIYEGAVDSVGFDEAETFVRTIPAITGDGGSVALLGGARTFSTEDDEVQIAIPSFQGTKLISVEWLFGIVEGSESATMRCSIQKVHFEPRLILGLALYGELANTSASINASDSVSYPIATIVALSLTNPGTMFEHPALIDYQGHCYYTALAHLTTIGDKPVHLYGIRCTYSRLQMLV